MEKRTKIFLLILLVIIGNVIVVDAKPGKLIHNAWNPPGVYLGITTDDISLKNDVKLCQPTPTDNVNNGVKWSWCNVDFTYSLRYFPLNDLPSGGNSGRISKSEMVIAVITLLDNDPASDGYIRYSWYKKEANVDKLLVQTQELPVPACGGYPPINNECGIYGSVTQYSYIGHFSDEIEEGGYYYVIIDTKWGQTRIDFGVVPVPNDSPNSGSGDGILTVVTPVPKVTSAANIPEASVIEVTPVATPIVSTTSYNIGSWTGYRIEQFLSGIAHGFWNGVFG